MASTPRKIGFILAATDQGTLILNRFDYHMIDAKAGYGVGFTLLERSAYDTDEVTLVGQLLAFRRHYFGDGVIALDCGANIGVFTVEWAKAMTGWGSVLAIEAQERIYYALAGNIAINNCFNARAIHAAVDAQPGTLRIPRPDYLSPGTFGSLELRYSPNAEFIGQSIDYSEANLTPVPAISIDSLALPRIDLLKIDVERMEMAVLTGAQQSIGRHLPIILVERLKAQEAELDALLAGHGYRRYRIGLNLLAIHPSDPTGGHITQNA